MEALSNERFAPADSFTLRVPIKPLGKNPIAAFESAESIQLQGLQVRLDRVPPLIIVYVEGFASEDEAVAFIPRVQVALWALVLRWNIAFRANFAPKTVEYAPDPVEAGKNIARSFGLPSAEPVDGVASAEDTIVYPTGSRLKFLGLGEITGSVQTPKALALQTLEAALGVDNSMLVSDNRYRVAIELFNGCFYEASLSAKFLVLMTILEVLAPTSDKHPAVLATLAPWSSQLSDQISSAADADTKVALESLQRELQFKRETSIRQRIRQLVRAEFADLSERERVELEKSAVSAYDARGTLVHTGWLAPADLDVHHAKSDALVRRLLSRRLGIAND